MSDQWISEVAVIVVPLDGHDSSVRGVQVAGRVAGRLGIGIRLFSVVGSSGAVKGRKEWLDAVAAEHLPGREAATDVEVADDEVPAIAAAAGSDGLLCMATSASLLPHHGHFGSTAEGVARTLRRPVLMVGPRMEATPGSPTRRVVVPVDGSELSEAALQIAAALAGRLEVPLWVVSVVSPKDEAAAAAEIGSDSLVAVESSYVRGLASRTAEGRDIDVAFEVLHSKDPAEAIVDFVGDEGTAVMTTHGRSGLSRLFAGSVTAGVVAHSKRAVVVLRPDAHDG